MTTSAETQTDTAGDSADASVAPVTPAIDTKRYSEDELQTYVSRAKTRTAERAQIAERKAWLERLGLDSIDEADQLIAGLKEGKAPAPKRSESERVAERLKTEYEARIAAAEQRATASEAKANAETIRAFLLSHVADTNDPQIAMSLFGVGFEPEERLVVHEGKLAVFASDGTPLLHKDPAKWVQETLKQDRFRYLQKYRAPGTGARVVAQAPSQEPTPPVLRTAAQRASHIRDTMARSFLADAETTKSR